MIPSHKVRDYSFFALIAIFLSLFLTAILLERFSSPTVVSVLFLGICLLFFGFYHTHKKTVSKPLNIIADGEMIAGAIIGAVLSSFLNISMHLGPVLGAAIVGTVAGFGLPLLPHNKLKNLAAAVYCGAFVGMTATTRFTNPLLIGLAGGIAGLIFICSQNIFLGFGGKLGTIAFVGTAIVMVLIGVFHG